MTSVLMVLSASDHWTLRDGSTHPTGFWAEEFVVPYDLFTDAGWTVTVATPGGRAPTVDRTSLGLFGGLPHKTRRLRASLERLAPVLASPHVLAEVDQADYDVVFYPGGHGPMEDLSRDGESGSLLAERLASGRPLAMLCHAPAAVLAAPRDDDGTSPFSGYRMTGFSDREETLNGLARKAPWLVESALTDLGVHFSRARLPLRPHVVVDRNLYSGQNPASSQELAERIIGDVRRSRA